MIRYAFLGATLIGLTAGCGREDSDATAEALLRRKRQRESAELVRPQTIDQQIQTAESYLADDNLVAARQSITGLQGQHPDDPRVILLAARIQAAAGQTQQAVDTLAPLERSDDTDLQQQALWTAGQWLIDAQQYDAARQKLDELLHRIVADRSLTHDQRVEAVVPVHRKLASLLNNQGRRIEAGMHLRALAWMDRISEKELFAMITYSDPFIDLSIPKPVFGNRLPPAALAEAKRLRADGDVQQAASLTERLAQAHPDSTAIAAFLGRVYSDLQDQQQLDRWRRDLPTGIEREPEYWHALGLLMQRRQQHDSAVRCFAECVRRDPTDRFAYAAMAGSLRSVGDEAAAQCAEERVQWLSEIADIAKQIGREPGTPQQLRRMADLLTSLDRPLEAAGWRRLAGDTSEPPPAIDPTGPPGPTGSVAKPEPNLAASKAFDATLDDPWDPSTPLQQWQQLVTCGIDLDRYPLPTPPTNQPSADAPQPADLASEGPPLDLCDVADAVGLNFQYDNGDDPSDDKILIHQLTGGGIGVIDFDLDGWPDLYLTQGGGDAFVADGSDPNRLFRNLAGTHFDSVEASSQTDDRGYGQGVAVADLNQDGFPDLVVANVGPNLILFNQGDGTFVRQELKGIASQGDWTTSLAAGDLSGDGLPEVVAINYIDDPTALDHPCTRESAYCNPARFRAAADQVWQVATDGTLHSWDGCRGMPDMPSFGFGVVLTNLDDSAGNDLYITNDTRANHFWRSRPDEASGEYRLSENALISGCGVGPAGAPQGSMGIACSDFDGNGTPDLYITNFWNEPSDCYLQQTAGLFVPASRTQGAYEVSRKTVGWGTVAADFDHDGWADLAVLNGHVQDNRHRGQPYAMQPQRMRGSAAGFHPLEPQSDDDAYWSTPRQGRTLAALDYNRDGKVDLVANHLDSPAALLENRTRSGHWVRLELVGVVGERDAVGAVARIEAAGHQWTTRVTGGDGFLCRHESVLNVGVGDATLIDSLEITWPSGQRQTFSQLPADGQYLIVEGQPTAEPRPQPE
ncbi:hypothetical protein FYK55_16825 [Roseiconus nitratireducens]|uniref:ASPIC/UnbV domain-containing protein n=1 Tax=Roseiconus nitratireducens TaxID=2605748 RepID=A0A5M6D9J2_9BACT|nr:FG-GAP-like repeat-containing protein [Roseiconus nitratireducens]KAA5541865.1 hypothetical protein FYK55_16825 [Roseiconus nitratireducens]